MKQVLDKLSMALKNNNNHNNLGITVALVLLFLVFWCVSFYVLVNSYA